MSVAERVTAPESNPYSYLSPLEILRGNIETERLETIDLARVITENALIDENHANELAESMKQKRGQIMPIGVRAREFEGRVVYDIFDGYHRSEGQKRAGKLDIRAAVVYGCTDEELSSQGHSSVAWWETAIFLTPLERAVMTRLIGDSEEEAIVADELALTRNQVQQHMRSALRRRYIVLHEMTENQTSTPK